MGYKKNACKKLLIYTLFDKNGIVDRYITFLLDEIKKHVSEILVVVNGVVTNESRKTLELITPDILVRENKGFDIWGYKAGLDYYGWSKLEEFDEVILLNDSVIGPLCPFSEMFDDMDSRDVDFWGITMYQGKYSNFHKNNEVKYIQSYFIAIRKSMILSDEFKSYWKNLPELKTHEDVEKLHDVVFTNYFENAGFKWTTYIDTNNTIDYIDNPVLFYQPELIRDKKCPIVIKRCFYIDYNTLINISSGEMPSQAFDYIDKHTKYDSDMIIESILRNKNQLDISRAMAYSAILPTKSLLRTNKNKRNYKVALIFHIYYTEQFNNIFKYIQSMPYDADIILTTDTNEKKDKLMICCDKMCCKNVEILVVNNRGRGESALLIAAKNIVFKYDYICFAHVKRSNHSLKFGISGQSFAFKCYENILPSKEFVENVLTTFEDNPKLGILSPPPPIHSGYYYTIAQEDWRVNYHNTKNLADKIGLKADICPDKAPIAPLGGMFWFRTAAMKKLFEYNWSYDDFPEEPIDIDETILHAIERIYSYIVQDAGYYPARLYSDYYASIEFSALNYYLCTLTNTVYNLSCKEQYFCNLLTGMKREDEFQKAAYKNMTDQKESYKNHLEQALINISTLEAHINSLVNSSSWKLTAPLRKISDFFRIHNKSDK